FGYCAFFWIPPAAALPAPAAGQPPVPPHWAYVPPDVFVQPMYAIVADVQESTGAPLATFAAGIDDVLVTVGQTLYLARFEVQGGAASAVKDPAQFTWDFGDGTTGVGKSVSHVYFKEGPYVVKLKS